MVYPALDAIDMRPALHRLPLLIALTVTLAACGGGHKTESTEAGKDGKTDSQVVAKVNDQEISVHQLNIALSQIANNVAPEKLKEVEKQALDRLIDEEILVQRAVEKKLDRDPKVVQLIEAAKHQILARAYVDNLASTTTTATRADVDGFYDKHPELFSARRVYRLQQLQLFGNPDQETLRNALNGSKNLGDVAKNLAAAKVGFNENTVTISPEQLPMKMAEEFAKLKPGMIVVVPQQNGGSSVAQILATQDQTIAKDKAQPAVERFLNNQRQSEAVANEMKSLKEKAKIVYLGEFDPKHASDKKPDLGATGPGSGAVTVDQKSLASDPAGVVTVKKDATSTQPSGAVTVKSDRPSTEPSGVVTVTPDAARK
jgi:EpsD family peptidyl-prolyl cis-trans isomerase